MTGYPILPYSNVKTCQLSNFDTRAVSDYSSAWADAFRISALRIFAGGRSEAAGRKLVEEMTAAGLVDGALLDEECAPMQITGKGWQRLRGHGAK